MSENNKKRDLKTILKQFLTGAVVVAMTISLAGCAFNQFDILDIGGNDYSISQDYNYNNEETNNNTHHEIGDNGSQYPTPGNSDNNYTEEVGTSFNAFLYSTGSLSSVVGTDNFGMGMSAYTNNADRRLEVGNFNPITIKLSGNNYNEFVRWVDSKDVTYVYANLYNIDNVYNNIKPYQSTISNQKHQHTDLITSINKIPTVDEVYNKIISNSNEYLRTHPGYYSLSSDYTRLIAQILVNMVTDNYQDLSKDDITRIYCMLNDVTAVGIDSTDFSVNDLNQIYNARVTDEAVVMLDTEMIGQLKGSNTMERTIAHEVAHLFQRMCPDHKVKGITQIGGSQYVENFDNTGEANSLHFQWLYEAAAEQMSMNEYDAKSPLVYKNMVGYLHTLDLITLIRPNYDENSIATSQMSTDPNKIYEVFGAKTDEEKREIAHMLYSICYIQTEREDFVTVYEKANGSIQGKETTVKKIMKESIAQTMTKYFYKNLAERAHNGSVTLQDAFYLINTFEAALNLHIVYDDAQRVEYNDESLKFYIETQNKFFQMIAEDSGMTFEEIETKFNEYALIIKTDEGYQRNCQFLWLNQNERDYIGTVLTTNINSLTYNIRNIDYIDKVMTK
ncbi:MAG: hypothetical protein E7171_08330 [Firmicutes bacterium]|nr:hypothetical protein [Bacillota bacterium]